MKVIRPTDKAREWLRKEHPEVPCSRCAYCGTIGTDSCICYDSTMSAMMNIPYSHGAMGSCGFKWELKAAAREAYDRITYMGDVESLPPLVRDAYAILTEGLDNERKIRWNNERDEKGGAE